MTVRPPIVHLRCKGDHFGLRAELWDQHGPDIYDEWGAHSLTACVHWTALPDEGAAVCKRIAGSLGEAA